jgi:hypothetical protein
MSTWYRVNLWRNTILPVEVVKETPSFVTFLNKNYSNQQQRSAKAGEFFPTFEEARRHLMEHWKTQSNSHRNQMEQAHAQWGKLFSQEVPDKESK